MAGVDTETRLRAPVVPGLAQPNAEMQLRPAELTV